MAQHDENASGHPMKGELYFGIDSRHIRQLGRELVADRITAVSEVIKNAYDADATTVDVAFVGASEDPGGTLVITDNGVGMTLQDIESSWMRISTDYKERHKTSSRYGRHRAGRKGIGRFAAETLGSVLILSSTVKGSSERVSVRFDWESAYSAGTELTSVPNDYWTDPAPSSDEGTVLRIERLHDPWPEVELQRVAQAVLLLQPPFRLLPAVGVRPTVEQKTADPGFAVTVQNESGPILGTAVDQLVATATAEISGLVDDSGKGHWSLESERLNLSVDFSPHDRILTSGPFAFRAAYLIYARDALRTTGSLTVATARILGNLYGGVRLYRDGLRILPYGEPGNDWLGLDAQYRRRTILVPIARNNFFGEVLISREDNLLFVDTASREGVIANEAFAELRHFVADGLIWGAQEVGSARSRKRVAKRESGGLSRTALVGRLIAHARNVAKAPEGPDRARAVKLMENAIKQVRQEAEESDAAERASTEALLSELELLRILASVGGAIAMFSHEVRSVINAALGSVGDLEEAAKEARPTPSSIIDRIPPVEEDLARLAELAAYIDVYISHARRRQREAQAMYELIETFVTTFDKTLNRYGIKVTWSVKPSHLRTQPVSRSELEAVLFNFLTNSVKALNVEGQRLRKLSIDVAESDEMVVIKFQDSGIGIDADLADRVFEPFVTSSRASESDLGVGTGLGLKIVADIAEANGGYVQIAAPDPPFNTAFEFAIPAEKP